MSPQRLSPKIQPSDDAVDRVLCILRDVELSPAFEQQTLHAVQRKLAASAKPCSMYRRLIANPFAVAATAVFVCALLAVPLLRRSFPPDASRAALSPTRSTNSQATSLHPAEGKRVQHDFTTAASLKSQTSSDVTPLLRVAGTTSGNVSGATAAPVHEPAWATLSAAELAASEAAAPSRPEPSLPITAEERQIRRFTERHNAYQLAALDPRAEGAHERTESEDFRQFFAPPPELSGNLPLLPPEPTAVTPATVDPN